MGELGTKKPDRSTESCSAGGTRSLRHVIVYLKLAAVQQLKHAVNA